MAPSHSRLLLTWSLPIAVLLSYLWFKRKRIGARSDPGGTNKPEIVETLEMPQEPEIKMNGQVCHSQPVAIEQKKFSRSLSGVESAPIDIIMPRDMRSKSTPVHVSDEDLDEQIKKVKPPKNSNDVYTISKQTIQSPIKTKSPSKTISITNGHNESKPLSDNSINNNISPKKKANKSNRKQTPKKNRINSEESSRPHMNGVEHNTPVKSPVKNTDEVVVIEETINNPVVASKVETVKPMEKEICEITAATSTLNIDCEEFVPSSLETPLPSEFQPVQNAKHTNSESSTDMPRQGSTASSERDSANHSPLDPLLASPSLSNISDQESLDSGKGGSDTNNSPPNGTTNKVHENLDEELNEPNVALNENLVQEEENQQSVEPMPQEGEALVMENACAAHQSSMYDFVIPQELVGRLIGKKGSSINDIKRRSETNIIVRGNPYNESEQICVIEGYIDNINVALKLLREKFPRKKFPELTFERCYLVFPNFALQVPQHLKLIENINNDTLVSAIVRPNYLFVQQYTHPTYMKLNELRKSMIAEYNRPECPRVPFPLQDNSICAGYSVGEWYRVLIINTDTESRKAYVTFLDYGGYAYIDYDWLRQISMEHYSWIPFQAQACILTGLKPRGGDVWDSEAIQVVSSIAVGKSTVARIDGITEWDDPLVTIYIQKSESKNFACLNEELVRLGYAEYMTEEEPLIHPFCQELRSYSSEQCFIDLDSPTEDVGEVTV